MALESTAFRDSAALQACAAQDQAHVTRGAVGDHVARLQFALFAADGAGIADEEVAARRYGPSTAAAVLAYKTQRSIVNRAYQSAPDDIVGRMTVAALDRDMLAKQGQPSPPRRGDCGCDSRSVLARSASGLRGVTPVSAPAGPGSDSSGRTPRDKALARVGDAQLAILKTGTVLDALIAFRPPTPTAPTIPRLPPEVMQLFDKVWRNFGMPTGLPYREGEFPTIKTRTDFLQAIRSHYARMAGTLARGATLFHSTPQERLGERVWAWTLLDERVSGDPTDLPTGIHFGRLFADSGPKLQTEVLVHEAAHFKAGHNFNDSYRPDGEGWGRFAGDAGMLNPWSYSMFMLDVVFDRRTPFA